MHKFNPRVCDSLSEPLFFVSVVYKLSKRKTDDILKMLHTILFGRRGKVNWIYNWCLLLSNFLFLSWSLKNLVTWKHCSASKISRHNDIRCWQQFFFYLNSSTCSLQSDQITLKVNYPLSFKWWQMVLSIVISSIDMLILE